MTFRTFFVQAVQCRRLAGKRKMKLVVHSVINRYVLCATVVHSNALLRFRFPWPLDLEHVKPGREITVLQYDFSRLTHAVNCRAVVEPDVVLQNKPGRALML